MTTEGSIEQPKDPLQKKMDEALEGLRYLPPQFQGIIADHFNRLIEQVGDTNWSYDETNQPAFPKSPDVLEA